RLAALLTLFVVSTGSLYAVWRLRPQAEPSKGFEGLAFPHNFEQLRSMADYFASYRDEHFAYVVLLFALIYLYKQTFAIPGSFFLNVLAGALFGRWCGMVIVSQLTAVGATFCYLLSAHFAKPFVERYYGEHILRLKRAVAENRYRLFYFLLCARVFPLTPHWLLNICSPFVDVPLKKFALSVLLGLAPYNLICVQAGGIIRELHSASQVFTVTVFLELVAFAVALFTVGTFAKKATL
uniref:Transmembrane protein 41A n=1 Tax=Parascaris univalens TaxID=6257 RepID=A0A915B172_PARUN